RLYDVSCASAGFCMAVGSYKNGANYETLKEEWNGSLWSIVGSPKVSGTSNQGLGTVSCTSTGFCMAVGFYYNSANYEQTLAERWDGNAWRLLSSPSASATAHNGVNELSCTSATFCIAAGVIIAGSNGQPLIHQWN